MRKQIKVKIIVVLLAIGVAFSGFSQVVIPDLADLQEGIASFSEDLAKALPFNSSLGLNWSDAYVGKFIPSVPPHFGIGASFGFTTMKLPILDTLAGYFGLDIPFKIDRMFIPAYAGEARIGGLFLPFDVGFKIGYIPPITLWGSLVNMNYMNVGADLRWALVKGNVILPKISLGIGVNYLKGGVGATVGTGHSFTYLDEFDVEQTISLSDIDANFEWESTSIDFKAQISKSFLIITPYAGIGASYAWSKAGYTVDATISGDLTEAKEYLDDLGLGNLYLTTEGMSSIIKNGGFNFRAFGGFSLNVAVVKFDFTALYSFLDGNFGGSFGIRFQL